MVKRIKRLICGIESLKKQIDLHFLKIEKDMEDDNLDAGKYHAKEIDKSLINALERKINLLDNKEEYLPILLKYKTRLEEYRKKFSISEKTNKPQKHLS